MDKSDYHKVNVKLVVIGISKIPTYTMQNKPYRKKQSIDIILFSNKRMWSVKRLSSNVVLDKTAYLEKKTSNIIAKRNKRLTLLLFAIPFVLYMLLFSYVPLFGWAYAFFDYKPGIPLFKNAFVGFENFVEIFSSTSNFMRSLINTLAISLISLAFSVFSPTFAIFLSEVKNKALRRSVQTMTTMPNFISWIIVYSLATSMFAAEGSLETIIRAFGFTGNWNNPLGNGDIVWIFQCLLSLWKSFGWGAIIYMAAIAGLDAQLYEAAKIDGAGKFQSIWHITVPGIAPTYLVMILIQVSNMLSNGFEQFFVFNNPMVAVKIEVIDLYVYNVGMRFSDYSFATAVGISKTMVSVLLLTIVNMTAKKIRGTSIF